MQRRLEIARGLLHAPRVLFLDEPTVGLDPQTRSSIWEYINDLKRREDITIFLTTHYMDEAENCDRIAIIDHGRIVAIDTPAALKASIGKDLRAATIVWRRELIRFKRDRLRAVTSLIQPLLFLLVLGTGLAALAGGGMPAGVNFKTFIYPGVLAMSVLFTAIFSAASIVWDREFGFLREMLVAPVSRAAIVTGKCLGGATIATLQGLVMLALAGLAGVPYNPVLLLTLVGEMLLLSFTLTAFCVMMAARIKQFQAFMALTQMLVMPLFFLSGALYPLHGLPGWLSVLTRLDPLTYIVDPMRGAVFSHLAIPAQAVHALAPGVTWVGWLVPTWLSIGMVAVMGLAMMGIAIAEFSKTE
jgi:ABC-2 type transport system permease protein